MNPPQHRSRQIDPTTTPVATQTSACQFPRPRTLLESPRFYCVVHAAAWCLFMAGRHEGQPNLMHPFQPAVSHHQDITTDVLRTVSLIDSMHPCWPAARTLQLWQLSLTEHEAPPLVAKPHPPFFPFGQCPQRRASPGTLLVHTKHATGLPTEASSKGGSAQRLPLPTVVPIRCCTLPKELLSVLPSQAQQPLCRRGVRGATVARGRGVAAADIVHCMHMQHTCQDNDRAYNLENNLHTIVSLLDDRSTTHCTLMMQECSMARVQV